MAIKGANMEARDRQAHISQSRGVTFYDMKCDVDLENKSLRMRFDEVAHIPGPLPAKLAETPVMDAICA